MRVTYVGGIRGFSRAKFWKLFGGVSWGSGKRKRNPTLTCLIQERTRVAIRQRFLSSLPGRKLPASGSVRALLPQLCNMGKDWFCSRRTYRTYSSWESCEWGVGGWVRVFEELWGGFFILFSMYLSWCYIFGRLSRRSFLECLECCMRVLAGPGVLVVVAQ